MGTYQQADFICSQESSAIHSLFAIETSQLKKFILLSCSHENNFTRQLDSQNIIYTRIQCLKKDSNCTKWGPAQDLLLRAEFTYETLALEIEKSILPNNINRIF